jgi:hypothetical protein
MVVSMTLRNWTLSEENPHSVIGRLLDMNNSEKWRTLMAIFDRVEGTRKLVNAFKSFVTVNSLIIFLPIVFSIYHRPESLKL